MFGRNPFGSGRKRTKDEEERIRRTPAPPPFSFGEAALYFVAALVILAALVDWLDRNAILGLN